MKQLIVAFILVLSGNCNAQFKVNDASLKIDTSSLITVCDCNAASITYMKEIISIKEEIKRLKIKKANITAMEEEIRKRDVKNYEVYLRCKPIYNNNRYEVAKCSNYAEGEELYKKISALETELK